MNRNYKLYKDSDLSEDQIESDVASYLGFITPFWSKRFRLKSVDEQLTGADKLFDRFIPLYLQFKVSQGLKPLSVSFNLKSPDRPLQRIRTFRRSNNITADPTLYFRLRDKARTAIDFQHNILKSLHNPPFQFALYIAPLTLSIDEYNSSLELSMTSRFLGFNPFIHRNETLFTESLRQQIGLIPFLRGHISIPPHEIVTTSEHYYSYSKAGTNIAWHSGTKLLGDFRLSTQIINIYKNVYLNNESTFNQERYINFIDEFYKVQRVNQPLASTEYKILNFANYLKLEHNIKLMLLSIDKQ
ncbi:hypothetical protein ACVVIH_03505 [Chryseobacterium arthrosphaerae]|uniref:hypothetical protein n=1 Tax=Chryseobacterium arthrosphaerae TaxID=651561 RepID=UPI003D33DD44